MKNRQTGKAHVVSAVGKIQYLKVTPKWVRNAYYAAVAQISVRKIVSKSFLKINLVLIMYQKRIFAAEFQIDKEAIRGKGLVLIKNEEICIRCGLCAKRCPVGTITMQGFEEVVTY